MKGGKREGGRGGEREIEDGIGSEGGKRRPERMKRKRMRKWES